MGNGKTLKNYNILCYLPGNISRRHFLGAVVGTLGAGVLETSLMGCGGVWRRSRRPVEPRYETIAHEMLDIELEHERSKESFERLDSIITVAKESLSTSDKLPLGDSDTAIMTLKTIARVIDAHGFKYKKTSLLSVALRTKSIDCDGYSFLYLAVGEVLGLPIMMVRAPAHTFVRWQLDGDNYINWETTISAEKSDEYYIYRHNIPSVSNGISAMRSLDVRKDREKILANAYVNSGVEWLKQMKLKEAIERFDEAIKRDPFNEAPYYNKGLVYYHQGDMPRAVEWCQKAVSLNPNHMKSHAVLGAAYAVMSDRDNARKHFRRVKDLDPVYYSTTLMERHMSDNN